MKIFICTIGSPEGELDTFGIRSGAEGTQLASYAGWSTNKVSEF